MISATATREHTTTGNFWRLALMASILALLVAIALPTQAYATGQEANGITAKDSLAEKASSGKYKISFKANGGKGTMKAQAVKTGKSTKLKANKFTRKGYKFAGWNTKKNGKGKSYKNKAKVKNLAKAGKTVKLYAQWKKSGALSLKKAKKVYASVLKDLEAKHYWVGYKYVDIVGDKTVELVAWTYPPNVGMYKHDYVYTIKSGKPKLVLDNEFAPCVNNSVTYRKAAKSLVYYKSHQVGSSGSNLSYCYLKYSSGKYKVVAWKSRSWNSSEWSYWIPKSSSSEDVPFTNAKGVSISKAAFDKKVEELTSGSGVTINISWDKMTQIKNEANRYAGQ